ncbi:MAG: hypothetical protein ACRELY_32865 [Polyangiaceae bacterium]
MNACSAAPQDDSDTSEDDVKTNPKLAQMNDVSILLPLAKSQDELDAYLAPTTNGVGGELLSEKIFDLATGQKPGGDPPGGVGSTQPIQYKDLRAVAFRIDPCFANIGPVTDASKCLNQLRIIFQPLTFASKATTAEDGAVHVFYSLTRTELTTLLEDVIAIRQENGGTKDLGALNVHPIIASQGLTGNMWKSLSEDLLKFAGQGNLIRFTEFQQSNLDTVWNFNGFDIASGKTTKMVIPTLPSKGTNDEFFIGFGADFAGGFTPSTNAKDDMQVLGNTQNAEKASKSDQQAAFDAALRIQNPNFHSPNTIDCASCHMANPAQVMTGAKLGITADGNANAFTIDTKLVKATDMKQKTKVDLSDGLNLHMFSYKDSHAMIGMRVINESGSVVAYVNQNVVTK